MKPSFEINIEYNKSHIEKKTLFIEYNLNIYDLDKKIKKEEFNKIFLNLLPKDERKFFDVFEYDLKKKKVLFTFDVNKWFDSKIKILDTEDRFEKKVLINKVPSVISANINVTAVENFILLAFRTYLEKNKKFRQKVLSLDPASTHYTFKYNGHSSSIDVSVKPQFRHSAVIMLKSKEKKPISKKMDFDASVYAYLGLK